MSTKMSPKDQAVLDKALSENTDETLRRNLVRKYNAYYRHWKDTNILIAVFAMIGLLLAVLQWETQFSKRGPDGRDVSQVGFFTDFVVLAVSSMGAVAIVMKYSFEAVWMNYRNPVAFYKAIVRKQVEAGLVEEEDLTENFKSESPYVWIIKQSGFWFELILMLIVPIPFKVGGLFLRERIITI